MYEYPLKEVLGGLQSILGDPIGALSGRRQFNDETESEIGRFADKVEQRSAMPTARSSARLLSSGLRGSISAALLMRNLRQVASILNDSVTIIGNQGDRDLLDEANSLVTRISGVSGL